MMTLLSFMEKIYSDTKTLSMIYIIGSILLFIFIVLLIFSLRKPDKKTTKIIEEPNIDNSEQKQEEIKVEKIEKENIVEESKEELVEEVKNDFSKESNLENILNIIEKKDEIKEEIKLEDNKEVENNISAEIPSIDDYVDNIVNKTYEKNEQFSSVYVNTDTIKLEKVLDKLNVDDDIKEEIVPEDEKVEKKEINSIEENNQVIKEEAEVKLDNLKNALEEKKQDSNTLDKLEILKKSLEEKRNDVNDKQEDLKNKLYAIKNNNTNKLDDLKSKLDILKQNNN